MRSYRTTAAVAELLAVTTDKVTDLIRAGHLPAVNVALHEGGKARWRIAEEDLEAFLASRRTSPSSKHTPKRGTTYKRRYY